MTSKRALPTRLKTDKESAFEDMSQFYSSVGAMRHERLNRLFAQDTVFRKALVTYTHADDGDIVSPASNGLRHGDAGRLGRLWVHTDLASLYALPVALGPA